MKFDIDRFREILDTLSRNKSRSFLTGFGVFWGVFMLVALLGGGQGLKEMLQSNFEGFATNSAIILPQNTTKPYAGFRKDRSWCMVYGDVERLRRQVPELETVSPTLSHWGGSAVYGDKKTNCTMKGLLPDYQNVEAPQLYYGRFINDMDVRQNRKVCVIGKRVYNDLFPGGGDPCGKRICVDDVYYDVVGVDYSAGNMNVNLERTNTREIIEQSLAEYGRRMEQGNLTVIVNIPEDAPRAMADGRLLWRVLDNLFNNVCKYALAGTRVYIDAAVEGDEAVISVKNISRDPLNVSADELMERFVRGDSARHTEGSGLGLNIAQSLVNLMHGKFSLSIDGDLFKAEIRLPLN